MFTIGCDPEFFMHNKGKFISSIGKIGGSKKEPLPIGNGCSVQEDNVAVEFNTPPAQTCQAFIESINWTLKEISKRVANLNLSISQASAVQFDEDQLDSIEACTFGCDPDFNAWTGKENPPIMVMGTAQERLRTAGGHVHVGTDLDPIQVIKAMDIFLGCPSVIMDTDGQRRAFGYGKAGAFRKKPYGVEYRVLSNFWIWDKENIEFVYNQTQKALDFVKNKGKIMSDHKKYILAAIDGNNPKYAKHIMDYFGVLNA